MLDFSLRLAALRVAQFPARRLSSQLPAPNLSPGPDSTLRGSNLPRLRSPQPQTLRLCARFPSPGSQAHSLSARSSVPARRRDVARLKPHSNACKPECKLTGAAALDTQLEPSDSGTTIRESRRRAHTTLRTRFALGPSPGSLGALNCSTLNSRCESPRLSTPVRQP